MNKIHLMFFLSSFVVVQCSQKQLVEKLDMKEISYSGDDDRENQWAERRGSDQLEKKYRKIIEPSYSTQLALSTNIKVNENNQNSIWQRAKLVGCMLSTGAGICAMQACQQSSECGSNMKDATLYCTFVSMLGVAFQLSD